tara:strand:- start:45 stop:500 length:456 start_codon:yes stop_codon:yes gene_type:complete
MAHFAKLGANGKVIAVLTMDNDKMLNADGVEDERVGQEWLQTHNNWPAEMWIQTSYNTSGNKHKSGDDSKAFRGNYAGIGSIWDEENQIFWHKKPYPSWVKNITTAEWDSPIGAAPALTAEQQSQNDAGTHKWDYVWNESGQSWDLTDHSA